MIDPYTIQLDTIGNKILFAIFVFSFIGTWCGVKYHKSNVAVWISIMSLIFISVYMFRVLHIYLWGTLFTLLIPMYVFKAIINSKLAEEKHV